jgi:hypothetical protein
MADVRTSWRGCEYDAMVALRVVVMQGAELVLDIHRGCLAECMQAWTMPLRIQLDMEA